MIRHLGVHRAPEILRPLYLHAVQRTWAGSIRNGALELPSTRPNPAEPRPDIKAMSYENDRGEKKSSAKGVGEGRLDARRLRVEFCEPQKRRRTWVNDLTNRTIDPRSSGGNWDKLPRPAGEQMESSTSDRNRIRPSSGGLEVYVLLCDRRRGANRSKLADNWARSGG